jgi:hypothetical protein
MKHLILTLVIGMSAWLMPHAALAVAGPPVPEGDSPFFGWLAIPAIGVVGHRLIRGKRRDDDKNY